MIKVFLNKKIPEAGMTLLKASNKIELIQPTNEDLSHEDWLEYCKKAEVIANVVTTPLTRISSRNAVM